MSFVIELKQDQSKSWHRLSVSTLAPEALIKDVAQYQQMFAQDKQVNVDTVEARILEIESQYVGAKKSPFIRVAKAFPSAATENNAQVAVNPTELTGEMPSSVRRHLDFLLQGLNEHARVLKEVRWAYGNGHNLAVELKNRTEGIVNLQKQLQEFRELAKTNKVHPDEAILAAGGEPDFTEFGGPGRVGVYTPESTSPSANADQRAAPESIHPR
jgi:DNA-binding transcriptional MocR family regulator